MLHPASFIYDGISTVPDSNRTAFCEALAKATKLGIDGHALMRHQLPETDQFTLETEGEQVLLEALPMLIEAGFQNAGLVAMELLGYNSLPVGIGWSTMLRVPDAEEVLRLRSVQTASLDEVSGT